MIQQQWTRTTAEKIIKRKKTSTKTKTKTKTRTKTRIIRISEDLYQGFREHSSKQRYNAESYETVIQNLLDCYDKNNNNNNDYKWF